MHQLIIWNNINHSNSRFMTLKFVTVVGNRVRNIWGGQSVEISNYEFVHRCNMQIVIYSNWFTEKHVFSVFRLLLFRLLRTNNSYEANLVKHASTLREIRYNSSECFTFSWCNSWFVSLIKWTTTLTDLKFIIVNTTWKKYKTHLNFWCDHALGFCNFSQIYIWHNRFKWNFESK